MLKYIFGFFIVIGILYSFINGVDISDTLLTSGKVSIDIIMSLIPLMCLWLGIMNVAIESGLLNKMTSFFKPILKIIFPDLKKEDKSLSLISSNIVMNIRNLFSGLTGVVASEAEDGFSALSAPV